MRDLLEGFFSPKSVAVIGASAKPGKVGHCVLENFVKSFDGEIFPVNRAGGKIMGLKARKSVRDIPGRVDMAVVAVPVAAANSVVEECVEKRVKAVVIITAGYRESGPDGIKKEAELRSIIRRAKGRTRVLGPNCIGVYDSYTGVDTLFSPHERLRRAGEGSISVISQSGAFGTMVVDVAAASHIGINKFVSYGNRADVEEADLIDHLRKDRKTKLVIMYIEGPKNGRKLFNALKKTTRTKPVIVLKAGESEKGAAAAASHTGSLAGSYEVFMGAMRQAGAISVNTVGELFDHTKVLTTQPVAKGNRVGIVTNGGGFGVLSSDAAQRHGLELAGLAEKTVKAVKKVMPVFAPVRNPADIIGDATAERFEAAVNAMIDDRRVDVVTVFLWALGSTLDTSISDVIVKATERSEKPVVVGAIGSSYTQRLVHDMEKGGVPVYPTPNRVMSAVKALVEYGRVRRGLAL